MKIANYIGGFRPFHNGHISMIEQALKEFDKVRIIVGSYDNAISIRCPFTGEQRAGIIKKWIINNDLSDRIFVSTNNDYLDVVDWLDSLEQFAYYDETFIVCEREGTDYISALKSRFNVKSYPIISEISATQIRDNLFDDEFPRMRFIKKKVPQETYEFLESFQKTQTYHVMWDEYHAVAEIKRETSKLKYPPIYVCADAFVLVKSLSGIHIVLIRRGGSIGYNQLALPGGYVNQNETVEHAAIRELYEETGISFNNPRLHSGDITFLADYPSRSVRGRVISHVFLYVLDMADSKLEELTFIAGDDASKVVLMNLYDLDSNRSEFFEDHYLIISQLLHD